MEKIFQILVVFALLMLIVARYTRGRESRYSPYDYLTRRKPPLPEEVVQRLISATFWSEEDRRSYEVDGEVDAFLFDEVNRLLFCYRTAGSMTIFRQLSPHKYKEMQSLAVPLDCIAMGLDPQDGKLYFEVADYLFLYGPAA
jgi:hypothetical protein